MIEVEKSNADSDTSPHDETPAVTRAGVPALNLQSDDQPRQAQRYELEELLRYHDRDFVSNLYFAIYGRGPGDEEQVATLDDLRSGRRTKIEIIEDLLSETKPPAIEVSGLSSPRLRAVSRWPVIGYWIRLFLSLNRLPVLIRHQQQFEAHALGQQQKIADYLNEVVPGAMNLHDQSSAAVGDLASVVNDAVDSVTMLSDSLIDLSVRQTDFEIGSQRQIEQLHAEAAQQARRLAETQTKMQNDLLGHIRQLQTQQGRHAQAQNQLQADMTLVASNQAAQQQALDDTQRRLQEVQQALQEIQRSFEETQQQTHRTEQTAQQTQAAVQETQVAVQQTQQTLQGTRQTLDQARQTLQQTRQELQQTNQQIESRQRELEQTQTSVRQLEQSLERTQLIIEEMQRTHSTTAEAQQEFLTQEQRLIVETQKVVLGELQTQLDEFKQEQIRKDKKLQAELQKLKMVAEPVARTTRRTIRRAGK